MNVTDQSIVYVVQEVHGLNLTDALRYGKLRALLPQGYQIHLRPEDAFNRLAEGMCYFRPQDFVLFVGDPVAIALTGMVAMQKGMAQLNMLKWDRQERRYNCITMQLNTTKRERRKEHHDQTEKGCVGRDTEEGIRHGARQRRTKGLQLPPDWGEREEPCR